METHAKARTILDFIPLSVTGLRIDIIYLMPHLTSSWAAHALSALGAAGYRGGGARARVVDLLGRQDCLLSAQEIFDELRREGRPVGIASVYRVLDVLSDLGLLQRLDLGEGLSRYEAVWPGGEHHHHLVCDDCGKVEAFTDPPLERALSRVGGRLGYALDAHDVLLRGSCGDCRTSA
jgi:Fur family transcriptional regulator, ferric uptake regulator